jgi:hypothetical protein
MGQPAVCVPHEARLPRVSRTTARRERLLPRRGWEPKRLRLSLLVQEPRCARLPGSACPRCAAGRYTGPTNQRVRKSARPANKCPASTMGVKTAARRYAIGQARALTPTVPAGSGSYGTARRSEPERRTNYGPDA